MKHRRWLYLTLAAALASACSTEQMLKTIIRDAIAKVDSAVAGEHVPLMATFNPYGAGLFVFAGWSDDLDVASKIWVSIGPTRIVPRPEGPEGVFALTRAAAHATPGVPMLSDGSSEAQEIAGLSRVPMTEVVRFLQTGKWDESL